MFKSQCPTNDQAPMSKRSQRKFWNLKFQIWDLRFGISLVIGTWTLGVLISATGVADEPTAFRFSKDIQTDSRTQEELVVVPFDSDVYEATHDNFSDLRVVDASGQAVPYLVQKATETKSQSYRRTWVARQVSLKPLEDDALEIRIKLEKDDAQPHGLRLITPLKNFEQRVRVFAANAAADQPLVPEALVFDYSKYMDVSHHEVRLPASNDREFRIVIDSVTSDQESQLLELTRRLRGGNEDDRTERTVIARRPFRIDRIEFWRDETQQTTQGDSRTDYAVKVAQITQDKVQKQTVIEITSRRDPLIAFRLKTSSRNFSRRASVLIPEKHGVQTDWREIGQTVVSQFEFRDVKQEHLELPFPEQRRAVYRIVLDNRDSPPLEIDGIDADGHVHQLVFLASPTSMYRLQYGADEIDSPQYDTAALQSALGRGFQPLTAKLGPQAASSAPVKKPVALKSVLNNPLVLGTAAAVLVAVLAWALFHAGRRIDQLPKDESPTP